MSCPGDGKVSSDEKVAKAPKHVEFLDEKEWIALLRSLSDSQRVSLTKSLSSSGTSSDTVKLTPPVSGPSSTSEATVSTGLPVPEVPVNPMGLTSGRTFTGTIQFMGRALKLQ